MKKVYIYLVLAGCLLSNSACKDFLSNEPEKIIDTETIFSDPILIEAVIANFYGRIDKEDQENDYLSWGINTRHNGSMIIIDDAAKMDADPDNRTDFEDDRFRLYDYTYIRDVNQFLESLRAAEEVEPEDKIVLEAEARFLRAWCYFNMVRGLGGVPIVGDDVFSYEPGDDFLKLQIARSSEADSYKYIISECQAVYNDLPVKTNINNARANRWTARMLEARAALYAGSLATYNNRMSVPIRTEGGEVGIPAEMAKEFYDIAIIACLDVINNSPYHLQLRIPDDRGLNFYQALSVKESNTEIMWCTDHIYPGKTVEFSKQNVPASHAEDIDNSWGGPVLNLVEQFEDINTSTPGKMTPFVGTSLNDQATLKFYDSPTEPFENRDPRLWGTVIYPGAEFRGEEVVLQAGQLVKQGGRWVINTTDVQDTYDDAGRLIVSFNGPVLQTKQYANKTGFYYRKFMDETIGATTRGRNSEMWQPKFRIAEAYMILAEAYMETGNNAQALTYINEIRERAGVQPLTSISLDEIVHERRVEFAFEDHRWWDLRRWRLAHTEWDGSSKTIRRPLWPYRVVAPGEPEDGKWVFLTEGEGTVQGFVITEPNSITFYMRNYYNKMDDDWTNKNPKLVKNPNY